MKDYSWLDALSDGKMFRHWLALFANFWFGLAYFIFIVAGFSLALSLSVVLIGIPLLLFMLATTRTLAALDRRLMAEILAVSPPADFDDVDVRGANLGERMGMYLGSMTTWRSLVYLALKFPVGIAALMAAMFILPFLGFEMLILGPLGIDMRLASVRLLHGVAVGMHKFPGILLPTAKRKRDLSRLESVETVEPQYYLD